jgi:hypothetical protein
MKEERNSLGHYDHQLQEEEETRQTKWSLDSQWTSLRKTEKESKKSTETLSNSEWTEKKQEKQVKQLGLKE